MKRTIFPKYKNVYKGNLHSHTTRSDGPYTVEKVISRYKEKGYKFLCISDHINYYISDIEDNEEFIVLDGMEGEIGEYHIHAVADYNVDNKNRYEKDSKHPNNETNAQNIVNEYYDHGNICIINHPRWSKLTYEEVLNLDNCIGVEVYNNNCDKESSTGYAVDYLDYALQKGKKLYVIASDDAHVSDIDYPVSEYFGGWICVSSESLSQKDIVKNIKEGNFYASNGPSINKLSINCNEINIETSNVKSICFITYPEHGNNVYDKDGKDINNASFKVEDGTKYLRIEITERTGKKAWSNPIYFDK